MQRSQCEKENVQLVQELAEVDGPFESPINVNFRDLIKLELPSLTWNKPDAVPKKMKITNTGHTVIISGKWKSERPYLTGGPLDGKYVFSQIHFHWGPDNCKGSEHQVCGESFPLEMHVAHFKSEYMTQEAALREKDGMVVIVYLFKLQEESNNSLKKVINALPCIRQSNSCQQMENQSILALCNPFTDDYFMYWGSVVTSTCAHILLWIVCREPFGISRQQMEGFRKLLDSSQHPILRNGREPQPLHKRNVFHVNASRHLDEPMLPIKKIMGCFCDRSAADPDDSRKSEGDRGCCCSWNYGPQEELEDRKDPDWNQQTGISRDNGIYTQQTVYCQLATVQSIPTKARHFRDLHEDGDLTDRNSNLREEHEVSQSCCFLSIEEEKSLKEERRPRERFRDRRRRPIDSVTTLTNLIETLETLKVQTYKKLKEIENINDEIRGMRSSCENLQEKNWLRQAEKIMSRQKRFTIRSSQCCFSELKKLAKECNFDKLLDDKLLTGTEKATAFLLNPNEVTGIPFLCSKGAGDRNGFYESGKFIRLNSERFSRKSQKLIRSFFEDIKESEETQIGLEKSLLLKKFDKLSRRTSDQSTLSSLNFQPGHAYITKKMMNMGRIRNQFFTEVPSDEKIIPPQQAKLIQNGKKKKKKNRSFFKIRLGAFENEKPDPSQKVHRSLFTRSALAWLNDRFSNINDNDPIISLRLRDIKLKSGTVSSKKISKHSLKTTSIKKVISDEHVRTEVSSYVSESFISEFSDKHSRYSRQSRTRVRNIIHEVEKSLESGGRNELSLMKFVKDLDANKIFMQMNHSANLSSGTSTDTEKRSRKFRSRRSRKDLWEKNTFGIFHKECNKVEVTTQIEAKKEMRENELDKRVSSSTVSSSVTHHSKREIALSCHSSINALEKLKDVGVDAMETLNANSPRRKKLRLDGKKERDDCEPDTDRSGRETSKVEAHIPSYVESECQADVSGKLSDGDQGDDHASARSRDKTTPENGSSAKTLLEKDNYSTDWDSSSLNANESKTEMEMKIELTEYSEGHTINDTSIEDNTALPTLLEDVKWEEGQVKESMSQSEAAEVLLSPKKSSESKDFLFDLLSKELVSTKFPKVENACNRALAEEDLVALGGLAKAEESSLMTEVDECSQPDTVAESSDVKFIDTTLRSEESQDRNNIQTDNYEKESEFSNIVTIEEKDKGEKLSRDVSQNDLSECIEYDLQTNSNGTMTYSAEKELQSRDSTPTPSIPSSEDEKHDDASIATAPILDNIHSEEKPLSADSLNSITNPYEANQPKGHPCTRNKSKLLVRKSNSALRKLSTVGGSNVDFSKLSEEEQLKFISANVAKFVKQKLVEHRHFFDFGKSENMDFDIEAWSKSAEVDLYEGSDDPEDDGKWEKGGTEEEQKEPEMAIQPETPPTEPPSSQPSPSVDQVMKESPNLVSKVMQSTVLSPAGDNNTDKLNKDNLRKQTLDFVKLNKIMAGKYKRGTAQEGSGKLDGKKVVKKEPPKTPVTKKSQNEPPKMKIPKPGATKQDPGSLIGRGVRPSSVDNAKKSAIPQGRRKSDIPVLLKREQSRSSRIPRIDGRSDSLFPTPQTPTAKTTPTPSLALQKPKPPKKRLVPTYTLTSYLPAPSEVIEYQQREWDKYLTQTNNIAGFFLNEPKDKKYKGKKNQDLSKKNLDYLIMLQKRLNHEITSNIENSMNYVQTLLNQDYNGTAIIEKAPVKNSPDMFEPGMEGIVVIEMSDQFDCSSSSSQFSEESGFYCIYREKNRRESNGSLKPEIIVKREESGDSGLVDSRIFEGGHDTDPSYSCEVSIFVTPEEEKLSQSNAVSDVLKKYIYHLGSGEDSDSCYISNDALISDELVNPKPHPKKRRDRVLDLSKEMKRKLLDVLEDEIMGSPPPLESETERTGNSLDEKSVSEDFTKQGEELESVEMMSKISDMVKLYLNEYDRTQGSDDAEESGENPSEVHS